MAYFMFGKEQRDEEVHRTSNEQQGCSTILRSVKITVTVSPGPHRETLSHEQFQRMWKRYELKKQTNS